MHELAFRQESELLLMMTRLIKTCLLLPISTSVRESVCESTFQMLLGDLWLAQKRSMLLESDPHLTFS
jgi:hypothetical protein